MPVILAHGVREGPLVAFVETGGEPAAVPVIVEVVEILRGDMYINSGWTSLNRVLGNPSKHSRHICATFLIIH